MFQSFYIFKCNINVSLSNSAPRVSLLACLVPSSNFLLAILHVCVFVINNKDMSGRCASCTSEEEKKTVAADDIYDYIYEKKYIYGNYLRPGVPSEKFHPVAWRKQTFFWPQLNDLCSCWQRVLNDPQ